MIENLTRPQARLLKEVADGDDGCNDSYGPAIHLVKIGLLEWVSDYRLALTDAGRQMLAEGSSNG